jgi:hypothetical protein
MLIIKAQNGSLIDCKAITPFVKDSIFGSYNNSCEEDCRLGLYETEERRNEVLEEIYSFMLNGTLEEESYTANKDNSRLIKYPRIFVMPKE